MKKKLMVDIETLATSHDAVVASVGAVMFNEEYEEIGDPLYVILPLQPQIDEGRKISEDTLKWWMNESDEARHSTFRPTNCTLDNGLEVIRDWLFSSMQIEEIWAKPPNFDLEILGSLLGGKPWKYWAERCMRTVEQNYKADKGILPDRDGTFHNALDDARYQLKCLQHIHTRIEYRA
jgi:hypothetical protein